MGVHTFSKGICPKVNVIARLEYELAYNDSAVHRFNHYTTRTPPFQAVVVSILLYGCTTWTLTKRMEKKLDSNYTKTLRAILNKSWRQHATKQQLYSHLPPITKTIKIRRTRHAEHCWRSKDELISDVLLWTLSHGREKAGQPARTYIQQFCADTGCSPEDLPEAMDDREGWRERVRDIHTDGVTWWWWWFKCSCMSAGVNIFLVPVVKESYWIVRANAFC